MKILRAYMRKIFNENSLQKGSIWPDLEAPKSEKLKDHLRTMQNLPEINNPEIFGLPKIFENSLQRKNVEYTANSLKKLSLGISAVADDHEEGQSNEKMITVIQPIISLWKSLLAKIMSVPELVSSISQLSEDVMISTVQQEILNRQKIIKQIGSLFKKLDEYLGGTGAMTSQVKSFSDSLMENKLPAVFDDIWDGCLYPDEWIRIIGKKTLGLKHWIEAIKTDTLYSARLPLAAFIDPEVVLNSLRQKTCRQIGTSLDKLKLSTTFTEPSGSDSSIFINVGDLVLEGCSLKGSCLEADDDASEKTKVRSTFISYVLKEDGLDYSDDSKLEVPVYLSSDKDLFLTNLKCAYLGDRDDIILGGTSFYLI